MSYPNFFQGCRTPNEVRHRYRDLAKQYHPDLGGDNGTMTEINYQHEIALQRLSGTYHETRKNRQGQSYRYTYTYDRDREDAIARMIIELLRLKMARVTVELVGSWIWVYGNTRPYKEALKAMKLRWSGKRKKWYYTQSRRRRRAASKASFEGIRTKYGSRIFQEEEAPA